MHDVDRYLNQPVRLNGIKIVHGTADGDVPIAQARGLDTKLTDLGIDHVYVEHAGGHQFIDEESLGFLSDHLIPTTEVEISEATAVPSGYALSQNYSNPFNPTTNFEYRIADFGFVSFKIFDLLGREVATLVNEEKHVGIYEVKWDAEGLSSGVYFYQLRAGNFVETKKLVLLK